MFTNSLSSMDGKTTSVFKKETVIVVMYPHTVNMYNMYIHVGR